MRGGGKIRHTNQPFLPNFGKSVWQTQILCRILKILKNWIWHIWIMSRNSGIFSLKSMRNMTHCGFRNAQHFAKFREKFNSEFYYSAKFSTIFCWNIENWAVQKHVILVDLVKSFPTHIHLQNLASIQPRTSLSKFGGWFNSIFNGSILSLVVIRGSSRRWRMRCGQSWSTRSGTRFAAA